MSALKRWNDQLGDWEIVGPPVPAPPEALVVPITVTTSRTIVATDAGAALESSSLSNLTLTVPPDSTTPFPIGTVIEFFRGASGGLTIAAGAGVTIYSVDGLLSLRSVYSTASIRKRLANIWVLAGDLI